MQSVLFIPQVNTIGNVLGWLVFVAFAVLFGWLPRQAWRVKNALLKWGGVALSGLLTLVLVLLTFVLGRGLYILYMPRNYPVAEITVARTPEQIARGEHLSLSLCAGCHSSNGELPLNGGFDVGKDSPVPIGELIAFNLTPGGPLKDWSDGEIFRVIRQGVDRDGRRLITMSNLPVRHLSDDDILAVIAYLRSQPTMSNPPKQGDYPNLLLAVFVGANLVPPAPGPIMGAVVAPLKGPTAEFGKYVLSYNDCDYCHGPDYTGGTPGGLQPVGPTLRLIKGWTRDQFITTLRTGVDPSVHELDSTRMFWKTYRNLEDDELAAIYEYLHGLP